ncbi:MAG: transposase family protein [Magnetococcales bacterium]|nr:transposase family protein [Magnetococcales bacterium]MBF0115949.1 transposase family protein [Magnetococcales bacterium]
MQLAATHSQSLLDLFADIPDPRRTEGRRHKLATILAIAAATLCGMRGYKAISDWATNLGQKACKRFSCRRTDKGYVPSNVIRLRRFAIGAIKSKGVANVAQKMRQQTMSVRLVFDYLHMTQNTCRATVSQLPWPRTNLPCRKTPQRLRMVETAFIL